MAFSSQKVINIGRNHSNEEMLDMYLAYDLKNGTEYAKLCTSHWKNGKDRKTYINLGRVIDKEKHIFRNRARGVFSYDIETNTYTPVETIEKMESNVILSPSLILNFGDVWFIDQFIKTEGLDKVLECIPDDLRDTFSSLVCFYILNHLGLCHAQDWFENSAASILYPDADLRSQRISEQLAALGEEELWRKFFKQYFLYLKTIPGDETKVLIDSTGLPNSIHFPLTGVSNHNGKISNEIRLIFVTEQETGMPVYMRYVNGTIPDVSTVDVTFKELSKEGIVPSYVLMDAGYYSEKNVQILHRDKIDFVCRMKENLVLFKELCGRHSGELEQRQNLVKFNRRLAYIRKEPVKLALGIDGFGYICMDISRRAIETQKILDRIDPKADLDDGIYDDLESKGLFVLVSSTDIPEADILPVYYTRQEIEQAFDVSKNYASALPVRTQSEETFRGHLFITFVATSILKRLQYRLIHEQKKRDKNLNPVTVLQNLGYQHGSLYEDKLIVEEANSKANQAYRLFGIESPKEVDASRLVRKKSGN